MTDQPALETPVRRPDGLPTRTKRPIKATGKTTTKATTKASTKITMQPAPKPRAKVRVTPAAVAGPTPAPAERTSLDLARRIVELAEDKKAADIVLLDLGGLTTLADYFVIASGGSDRQLDAIADGIITGLRDEKVKPFGREGTAASHWVLVDYGGVIVHVFTPPERDFYQLERHWSEAKTVLRVQ